MGMAEAVAYWQHNLTLHGYDEDLLENEGFCVEAKVRPDGMSCAGELWWHGTHVRTGETKWLVQVERIVVPEEGMRRKVVFESHS